jgi:hypothetical protein
VEAETIRRLQADNAALAYAIENAEVALDDLTQSRHVVGAKMRGRQVIEQIGRVQASGGARFLELLRLARVVAAFGLVGTEMDEALLALRQTVVEIDKEGVDA